VGFRAWSPPFDHHYRLAAHLLLAVALPLHRLAVLYLGRPELRPRDRKTARGCGLLAFTFVVMTWAR